MRFVEKFEPICRMKGGELISLGLFNSYEEANDAAIIQASVTLPEESMQCYEIHKVHINQALWTSQNV